MRTSDGRWRVEAVRAGAARWYRIRHGENVVDCLDLEGVQRMLAAAGVGLHHLREVEPAT